MRPSDVYDALHGKSFTYLECANGNRFGGTPLAVNFCSDDENPPACIGIEPDGLTLHFNSNGMSGMHGESVPFGDIVAVG
jgi:hypothetical protein